MNIFVLDTDPKLCAEYTSDKHVVKMITEHTQMLSTVAFKHNMSVLYKPTHPNHPCTLWVGESLDNWCWLQELQSALHEQYLLRYPKPAGHQHKAFFVSNRITAPTLPKIGLTPFAQCMPPQYRGPDPVQAYRDFYMGEKRKIAQWKHGVTPHWWA